MRIKTLILALLLMFFTMTGLAQVKVQGSVVDQNNEPMVGVAVQLKGKAEKVYTITDLDGNFSLSVPENSTLIFSCIGMKTQEIKVKSKMKVIMEPDSELLQEIVVTGLVATDKRMFTGATDKLKADMVKIDGMADISRGLEGKAAGVSIQNISGTFGTAPKIRVRGATSIYGNSKPLWVVDGVIQDNVVDVGADDLSSGDAVTLISSAIAGLNADDIESFQILKDGSATSIYGAKAMAGVIVITTKKGGGKGTASLAYTGEFTTRLKPDYGTFNIMNSQDQMAVYEELRDKGWLNFATIYRASDSGVYGKMYQLMHHYDATKGMFGLPNTPEARAMYLREAEYRNTDWFNLLFSNSIMMNHSVSISTGSEKSSSYISLSAMTDPGWMKQSSVSRYTANLNNTYKITDRLDFTAIANMSYRSQKAPGTLGQSSDAVTGMVSRSFDINPYSYALNTSRTLDPREKYMRNYSDFNIFDELKYNNISLDIVDMKFQSEFKYRFKFGLQLNALGALKYSGVSQKHMIHDLSNQAMAYRAMTDATVIKKNSWLYKDPDKPNTLPETVLPKGGFANTKSYKMLSYDLRFTGTYNKELSGIHFINTFFGAELNSQSRSSNWYDGWGMQYENGELPFFDYMAFKRMKERNTMYYGMDNTIHRQLAFFGTATYSYKHRYTVTGTYRYEGSNRLGKSRTARWLPTWNIAGAWNVHEEPFFKNQSVLNHLTLKASYSLTADAGPSWVANSTVIIKSWNLWRPTASTAESAIIIADIENKNLTYEKKHELNIGVDVGLLNNRINLAADWYRRNNFDLIGWMTTQGAGGEIERMGNVATMKSQGFEVTLSTKNIKSGKFSWTSDFIFGYTNTLITDLKTREKAFRMISGNGFALKGYPHRSLFSIPFNGLDEDGFPTFTVKTDKNEELKVDKNNYKSINFQQRDNLDYLKYEGPTEPTVTGSFGNVFTLGNWKLNVFITYSAGNKLRLDPVFGAYYSDLDATPKEFKNRWRVPGDEKFTDIPTIASRREDQIYESLNIGYNAYNYSSARVVDGSFVRMKEISLSYALPEKFLKSTMLKSASLKLQATNLFLIYADKRLNGQDPEFSRSGGVSAPVPKQFTFTVRLGF